MVSSIDILERKKEIADIMAGCPGGEIAKRWLDQVMMEI